MALPTFAAALAVSRPLAGKRIGLLTAHASRHGGGVAEAVQAQARLLATLGAEPMVFALADDAVDEARAALAPVALRVSARRGPRQLGFAPGQLRQLLAAELDLLHLHGIWMLPSLAGSRWASATGRPYLISPHGMLDPWITARGRWKKALARHAYERRGWRRAAAFHALTAAEASDIKDESGRGDTIVIPNAGPEGGATRTTPRERTVLYLGRIHPKKNLHSLIEGWSRASRARGARLVIAGWGDAEDVAELERRLAAQTDGSIAFVGPAFGAAKQRLLEEAAFMILPSFSEGLPMAILEAWAAGTPTLMSDACHLEEGFAAGAAIRCPPEPSGIATALDEALSCDGPAWEAMSRAAQALAAGRFSAATIAREWEAAYARFV